MAKQDPINGRCHYCGEWRNLTVEHVPPQNAFNSSTMLYLKPGGESFFDPNAFPVEKTVQGGVKYKRLCGKCNSDSGGWYGGAYQKWAMYGASLCERNIGNFPVFHSTIAEPAKIAKQIIGMFLTVNDLTLGDQYEDLRRYVLQRNRVGIPEEFALYCYLTRSNRFRHSGFMAKQDLETNSTTFASEISHFPFGYVLYCDSRPRNTTLFDISWFTRKSFHSLTDVQLRLPLLSVGSAMPTDFRTKEEMEATRKKHESMSPEDFPGARAEFREEQMFASARAAAKLEKLGARNPMFVTADPNLANEVRSMLPDSD